MFAFLFVYFLVYYVSLLVYNKVFVFQLLIDYVCVFTTIEDNDNASKCKVLSYSCCGNNLGVKEGNE